MALRPLDPGLAETSGLTKIAQAGGLALDAAMLNGIPEPVLHLQSRAMGIAAGLGAMRPTSPPPAPDIALGIALGVALGLANLLGFRSDSSTATTSAKQAQAAACSSSARPASRASRLDQRWTQHPLPPGCPGVAR